MSEKVLYDCVWSGDIQLQLCIILLGDELSFGTSLPEWLLNSKFVFACAYRQPYWRNNRIYRQHGPYSVGGRHREGCYPLHTSPLNGMALSYLIINWYLRSLLIDHLKRQTVSSAIFRSQLRLWHTATVIMMLEGYGNHHVGSGNRRSSRSFRKVSLY